MIFRSKFELKSVQLGKIAPKGRKIVWESKKIVSRKQKINTAGIQGQGGGFICGELASDFRWLIRARKEDLDRTFQKPFFKKIQRRF